MTTTPENITIAQVRTLRDEAGEAGDHEQVAMCELALSGEAPSWLEADDPIRRMTRDEAIEACAKVLAEGEDEVLFAALHLVKLANEEGDFSMLSICRRAISGDRNAAREVLFAAHVRRSA